MSWPEELLALVDEAAARQFMTRSEYVRYCVVQVLSQPRIQGVPEDDVPAVMAVTTTGTKR